MSVSGITNSSFDFSLLQGGTTRSSAMSNIAGASQGAAMTDFFSTLKSRIAAFQSQSLGALFSSSIGTGIAQGGANLAALFGADTGSANPLAVLLSDAGAVNGLSASGRNTTLADPESAYRMMSLINTKDVDYKAEYSEMRDMKAYLATMQQAAQGLGDIGATTGNEEIHTRLQGFADAYNGWIQRFNTDLQPGGVLAGTQAAQVSQWELEQSIEGIYNGALGGFHAMSDLGFTIDPVSNLASLDGKQLDAALASNKSRAVGTVQELSANFAKSAELLNSAGNFIPSRIDNLARVIDYIGANLQSLQAEFGLGDAAKPSGPVAKALANYNAVYAMAG